MPSTPLAPVSYEAIKAVRTLASAAAFPAADRVSEGASQTFQYGNVVQLSGGSLVIWDPTVDNTIYGVSSEWAHNLSVAGTPQQYSEGAPPNQPSASTTPVGAQPIDGLLGVYLANGQSVFSIALKAGQVFTQALLANNTLYGLVLDNASGFWYLDNTDTAGPNAVAVLLGVDPSCPNTVTGGSRVFFQFAESKRYFQ